MQLNQWVRFIRESCEKLDRIEVTDRVLGTLFATSLLYQNEATKEVVLNVMEEIRSENISAGVCRGLFNSRGFYWRQPGGIQEKKLSNDYKKMGEKIKFSHPFVSNSIYFKLAQGYLRDAEGEIEKERLQDRLRLS